MPKIRMIKNLWWFLFSGLVIYGLFYIFESILLIAYPFQISYVEGPLLNQAKLLSQGTTIFRNINDYPYLVVNYPPVFIALISFFVKIFGVSFAPGRILSFFATLATAWLIYLLVKKEGDKKNGVVAGLFFIASPYVFYYGALLRVDLLGLLLSIVGIWIALQNIENNRVYIAVPVFLAALYTKQTFLAPAVSVAIYLFLKNRRQGFIFSAILLGLYTFIFIIMNYATKGEFYKHNIIYNANIFSIYFAIKQYVLALRIHAVIVGFGVIYVLNTIINKKFSFWSIYAIIAAMVAFTVGKIGSNINYFLELIAIWCILTGLILGQFEQNSENTSLGKIAPVGLLLLQLVLMGHMPFVTGHTPTKRLLSDSKRVSEIIKLTPGPVISEDIGLLIKSGKEVLFQPFEFTQLWAQGLWDQTPFLKDIENRRFSLIILRFDLDGNIDEERFTPQMVAAMRRNYCLKIRIGEDRLYEPIADSR